MRFVRRAELQLAVEPARPPQRGIERVRPVRGADDDDVAPVGEAVHEREQRRHHGVLRQLAAPAAARRARGREAVQLVEEDDGRRLGLGLVEETAEGLLRLAHVLREAVGAVPHEERHAAPLGLGPVVVRPVLDEVRGARPRELPRYQRLARARRSVEEDPPRRRDPQALEQVRLLEREEDHLLERLQVVVQPGDALERRDGRRRSGRARRRGVLVRRRAEVEVVLRGRQRPPPRQLVGAAPRDRAVVRVEQGRRRRPPPARRPPRRARRVAADAAPAAAVAVALVAPVVPAVAPAAAARRRRAREALVRAQARHVDRPRRPALASRVALDGGRGAPGAPRVARAPPRRAPRRQPPPHAVAGALLVVVVVALGRVLGLELLGAGRVLAAARRLVVARPPRRRLQERRAVHGHVVGLVLLVLLVLRRRGRRPRRRRFSFRGGRRRFRRGWRLLGGRVLGGRRLRHRVVRAAALRPPKRRFLPVVLPVLVVVRAAALRPPRRQRRFLVAVVVVVVDRRRVEVVVVAVALHDAAARAAGGAHRSPVFFLLLRLVVRRTAPRAVRGWHRSLVRCGFFVMLSP